MGAALLPANEKVITVAPEEARGVQRPPCAPGDEKENGTGRRGKGCGARDEAAARGRGKGVEVDGRVASVPGEREALGGVVFGRVAAAWDKDVEGMCHGARKF